MGVATTYFPTNHAVSSALRGLTSLFGMGRGGPPRYSHHVYLQDVLDMAQKKNTRNSLMRTLRAVVNVPSQVT